MDDERPATALDPRLGVTLIAERAVAHVRARSAALDTTSRELSELLRTATHHEETRISRVPRDSLPAHLELLVRRALREVVICLREDWLTPEQVLPVDPEVIAEAHARGVRFRVLVDDAHADRLGDPLLLPATGLEWRSAQALPLSMLVSDSTAAALADDDPGSDTVRTTHPALVSALVALCESQWQHGASLGPAPVEKDVARPASPGVARPEILALLAAGHTDEAVARASGMSVRKLVRVLGELRQDLASETRFQMGVEAARRGLV